MPITFEQVTQYQGAVPTLIVDNRAFQIGQWVEIAAANKPDKVLRQIIGLDAVQGVSGLMLLYTITSRPVRQSCVVSPHTLHNLTTPILIT